MFSRVTSESAVLLAFLSTVCFNQCCGLEADSKLADVIRCLLVTLWVCLLIIISTIVSLCVVDVCAHHINPLLLHVLCSGTQIAIVAHKW